MLTMDPTKLLVIAVLAGIILSLGSALYHLSRAQGDPKKMLRALTLRVALSVGLFVLLFVFWQMGLIKPHGLRAPTTTNQIQ
jgi:formate/nitrite transporter FocA (FNT family)